MKPRRSSTSSAPKEALYEGVNVGEKDFSALIAKMKQAGVTVVYWGVCIRKPVSSSVRWLIRV